MANRSNPHLTPALSAPKGGEGDGHGMCMPYRENGATGIPGLNGYPCSSQRQAPDPCFRGASQTLGQTPLTRRDWRR